MSIDNPQRDNVIRAMQADHGLTLPQCEFVLGFVDQSITSAIRAAREQIAKNLEIVAKDKGTAMNVRMAFAAAVNGIRFANVMIDQPRDAAPNN